MHVGYANGTMAREFRDGSMKEEAVVNERKPQSGSAFQAIRISEAVSMSQKCQERTSISSNPNIILGCATATLIACVEDPPRLDEH
jgi:hypothetical protein